MKFDVIPEEWGIYCPRTKQQSNVKGMKSGDLELLEKIKDMFREAYYGIPIPYKFGIDALADGAHRSNAIVSALGRLWKAGLIEKFATTLNTISGRPQYISWYVWGGFEFEPPKDDVPQFYYDNRHDRYSKEEM